MTTTIRRRERTITLNLTRRPDGIYCKKIGGKMFYFGSAGCTLKEAQGELIDFIQSLRRNQPGEYRPNMSLAELASMYAADREKVVGRTTWFQYHHAIRGFVKLVGRTTAVGAINASHFETVSREWRKHYSGNRFNNQVQSIRTMFKWAAERQLIERLPFYGVAFKKLNDKIVRMERLERGSLERAFRADEITAILAAASPLLRTFFLLGLNGGMYSADISDLRWADIKRDGRTTLIDTTRFKTGIVRRVPLWPEVAKAINAMSRGGDTDRVFITRHGNPWHDKGGKDSIALGLHRLVERLGIHRDGVGFGSVRHTHISAVGDQNDRAAKRYVTGHLIEGIEQHYDLPSVARCKVVTDLARRRLLNTSKQQASFRGGARAHKHAESFAASGSE